MLRRACSHMRPSPSLGESHASFSASLSELTHPPLSRGRRSERPLPHSACLPACPPPRHSCAAGRRCAEAGSPLPASGARSSRAPRTSGAMRRVKVTCRQRLPLLVYTRLAGRGGSAQARGGARALQPATASARGRGPIALFSCRFDDSDSTPEPSTPVTRGRPFPQRRTRIPASIEISIKPFVV